MFKCRYDPGPRLNLFQYLGTTTTIKYYYTITLGNNENEKIENRSLFEWITVLDGIVGIKVCWILKQW